MKSVLPNAMGQTFGGTLGGPLARLYRASGLKQHRCYNSTATHDPKANLVRMTRILVLPTGRYDI